MKDHIRELINFVGNHDDSEATWRKNDVGYAVYDGSYQDDCRDTFNSISNYAGWKFRERSEKPVGMLRKCYEDGLVTDHFADDGTMFLKITDKALAVIAEHEADILDHIKFIKETN